MTGTGSSERAGEGVALRIHDHGPPRILAA